MIDGFSELSHLRSNGTRPVAVISLRTLTSLSQDDFEALAALQITTLSELLHFEPIHKARTVMAAFRGELGHDINLGKYLDNPPEKLTGIDQTDPRNILGIGTTKAGILRDKFGVKTIQELADFAPLIEAERLVTEQAAAFSESASAPDELIPRYRGAAPVTRARYSSFVREGTANYNYRLLLNEDLPPHLEPSLARLFIRLDDDGNQPKYGTPFNPDLGYALLHEQTWRPIGLQLGEPIHSIGLSPGEVRKVAIIDWRQNLRAGRSEDTTNTENLNSLLIHQRALDEVVRTTAEEHQSGRTDTFAATGLGAGASVASGAMVGAIGGALVGGATLGIAGIPLGALAGLFGGPAAGGAAAAPTGGATAPVTVPAGAAVGAPLGAGIGGLSGTLTGTALGAIAGSAVGGAAAALGGALLGSASGAIGHVESSSEGDREVFGRLNQNIMDVASQKASHVRSLRSSVVIDAEQTEGETFTTYVVANNNRAHALTVVYFELLNKYQVDIRTNRVDPLLYVPFSPLQFNFDLLARYWHVLRLGVGDSNLIESVDELLSSSDYFEGALDVAVGAQNPTQLNRISIGLKISVSWSDPLKFKVFLEAATGVTEIPYSDLGSKSTSGITFIFKKNELAINLESITGIRVTGGASFGAEATVRVRSMRLRSPTETIRHHKVGDFKIEPGIDFEKTLPFRPISLIQERVNAQRDENLVIDRVLDILNRNAYFFTRHVLIGIDPAEVEDLLEALRIQASNGIEVSFSGLVDLRPVGFVGGSIVFRLKRDPQLELISTANPLTVLDQGSGPLLPVLPNLPGFLDFELPDFTQFTKLLLEFRRKYLAAFGKFTRFIDEIKTLEIEERASAAKSSEIALPTSGLFAEAILGRSVSAELIDARRYIAWDLPNPNQPPNIADISAGERGQPIPNLEATVEEGTLTINNPTTLPDPRGFADAFGVLGNGNLFRDMSKSEQLTQTLGKLADIALAGATKAGDLAGDAQGAALEAANGLAMEVAKSVGRVADVSNSLTELGAKLNASAPVNPASVPIQPSAPERGVPPKPTTKPQLKPVGTTPAAQNPLNTELTLVILSSVKVEGGVTRNLNGTYFLSLADGFQQINEQIGPAPNEIEVRVTKGNGQAAEILAPGTYTIGAEYQANLKEDLFVLEQPQAESIGVNGSRVFAAVIDLLQDDLDEQRMQIRPDLFTVTPTTSYIRLDIQASIARNQDAEISVEFAQGTHYQLNAASKVEFNLSEAAPLIVAAISALASPAAGVVAGLVLKMFKLTSTIDQEGRIKAAAQGTVKFVFKPCFLQDFKITATVN